MDHDEESAEAGGTAMDRTTAVVPRTAATRASMQTPVPPARAAACGFSVPSRTASARDSALSVSAVLKAVPAPARRLQAGRHLISTVGMGAELLDSPLHVEPQRSAEVIIRGK